MTRSLLWTSLFCAAACTGGYSSARTPAAPAPAAPVQPAAGAARLQLAPGTTRYFIRQDVHIQQDFAGLPPTMTLGYGIYLTATIAGPADSTGFLTSFTVDSVTIDSGTQFPPQINLASAKGFRVTGRLTPTGEFMNAMPSDSNTAASLANVLPRFRSFFPRLPAGGIHPDTSWIDSTTTTEGAGATTITTHVLSRRAATTWEDRAGVRALRIEVSATYRFNGAGEQGGAAFTIDGNGTGGGVQYLAGDGRFLGGEAHDTTTLTIDLAMQGITIPRRQTAHTTVTALTP
jgi:hypothetical protein